MKGKPSSLYIHIPFCVKKCIYCDFFSVTYEEVLAERYVNALGAELELRRAEAEVLQTIYIGGGTPTTMPTSTIVGLLERIRGSFEVAADAEITIEANPGTVDKELLEALSGAGINRLSVGIQSFDDDELKLLGRIHTFEDALRAIASARRAEMANISIDLIYGIPGQTLEKWLHTLGMAVELSPQHLSAYELTPEKNTPIFDLISEKKLEKPDEESIVRMYYSAIDKLGEAGYTHYEISNFAKPGFECRHNLNYWNRGRYIGAGAAAHGFIGNERMRNTCDIANYIQSLEENRLPVEQIDEMSREDAIKETVFLGLRKTEGLAIEEFVEDFGVELVHKADKLINDGLLETDGAHLRLTRRGVVISNTVIARLFEEIEKE